MSLKKDTGVTPVCWILDHDKRLGALIENNKELRCDAAMLNRIQAARKDGSICALFGVDTECPPLPGAFVVRTQLVDVYHSLAALFKMTPEQPYVAPTSVQCGGGDYYHDVATGGGRHLESPSWYIGGGNAPSAAPSPSVEMVFQSLAGDLNRVLLGDAVFRPLLADADVVTGDRDLPLISSLLRGGSTFVLDPEALLDVVNFAPTLKGRQSRRSDMIWACLNAHLFDRATFQAPALTVRHVRRDDALPSRDSLLRTVVEDTWGAALYRALDALLEENKQSEREAALSFSEAALSRFLDNFEAHLCARFSAIVASLFRIRGLLACIDSFTQDPSAWWSAEGISAETKDAVKRIHAFVCTANVTYDAETWSRALAKDLKLEDTMRVDLTNWLRGLSGELKGLQARKGAWCESLRSFIGHHRIESARVQAARMSGHDAPHELALVGVGQEGVVFRLLPSSSGSGSTAVKYMDMYRIRAECTHFEATIRPLTSRAAEILPQGLEVQQDGIHLLLSRQFIEGEEFRGQGGTGHFFCQLIRECRAAQIVCNNICPKNLIVDGQGRLHFVDLGLDIVRWSPLGEEAMIKRSFLTFFWPHRKDLKDLLSRSLRETVATLPELQGLDAFRLAAQQEARQAEGDLYTLVATKVRELRCSPMRILDYGCGKGGKLLRTLAGMFPAASCVGFDPFVHTWPEAGALVRFTSQHEDVLREAPFDLVVCTRVVCCLSSLEEVRTVLGDLRKSAKPHANILLLLCHPIFVEGGAATPHQVRIVPQDFDGRQPGRWEKQVLTTGSTRSEHFLPIHLLRRELLGAGFGIEGFGGETRTVDVERFLPSSEYLLLHLRPLREEAEDVRGKTVSLVIRSCVMEWRTLYARVVHLSTQLEGPHRFHERVLLVDSRRDEFLREYDSSSVESFTEVVEQLVREGWVDKVHRASSERESVRSLFQRWFVGRDSASTHAANETPVTSSLEAFEASEGDLVLQVDSDIMVHRRTGFRHDFIADACRAFAESESCLSWSLNICQESDQELRFYDTDGRPFRVEVRASVWNRERLLAARPFPTHPEDWRSAVQNTSPPELDQPRLGWHRLVDRAFRIMEEATGTPCRASARGGGRDTLFVHPQNDTVKKDPGDYLLLLDLVEKGQIPPVQMGSVDLVGSLTKEWMGSFGPRRLEPIVFIVCGRDVPPPKWKRCLESLQRQSVQAWGAIFVDDGSRPDWAEYMAMVLATEPRVTLLQPRFPRGSMANHCLAILQLCADPSTIVATLDMDDCLVGTEVVARIMRAYNEEGADLTVGRMLRTDKCAPYAIPVTFQRARETRGGGNVWLHLRTFRQYLFARIRNEDLRDESGAYFDRATDWAYMLPLVEMARRPLALEEVLYLYEPSRAHVEKKEERELNAGVIVSRPPYSRLRFHIAVVGDASLKLGDAESKGKLAFELGKRLAERGYFVVTGGMGGIMEAVCRGAKSVRSRDSVTIGLLPDSSAAHANPFVDICIPTGLQHGRNSIVALADAVIVVGGGAGTSSEASLAWCQRRLVIAIRASGTSGLIASTKLDHRVRFKAETWAEQDCVFGADTTAEALDLLEKWLPRYIAARTRVNAGISVKGDI